MFLSTAVIRKAARECARQEVGPLEVYYLCDALKYAGQFIGEPITPNMILHLGSIIEPEKNRTMDYRHTPVVFKNGGSSAPHADVPRLIENWCNIVNSYILDENTLMDILLVKQLIRELLWVHPLKDGNGRLAFVLYNLLCGFSKFYRNEILMFVYPLPEFEWMN